MALQGAGLYRETSNGKYMGANYHLSFRSEKRKIAPIRGKRLLFLGSYHYHSRSFLYPVASLVN
ncbi:hypothetical protein, partial [Plesiomonas sp.]|uniref:hypothetical protein n=1 Tax=Plesiomonas sp. TaxID=2486279 RepID=UPI003F3EF882